MTAHCALPLKLHARYGRKDIFASIGVRYSQTNQNRNTGLSPRCPDHGYFLFITLNKEGMNPAYDYDDELLADRLLWVTRRGRRETHPDYVTLRQPQTRVSLFVRASDRERFAYLGEVEYLAHHEFKSKDGRPQQKYELGLKHRLSDELLWQLCKGLKPIRKPRGAPPEGTRRPSSFDDYKRAFSYALDRLERTVNPAHQHYQVRLKRFLENLRLQTEWEKDFIDVTFIIGADRFIGEIKVTGYLRLEEAFRAALGQLLDYAHMKFTEPPHLVMFLDRDLEERRLALATHLRIAVVAELNHKYRLLNPDVHPGLAAVFSRD